VKAAAHNGARASRRPTIDDVARHAGVSKGAVSLALNGRPGVSDATRVRIAAAADALGWRPSARAKALSESRALAIGLIFARPPSLLAFDPFFGQLLAGVETELASSGYALVVSVVGDAAAEAETYRRLAHDGRVDGILITDARLDDPRYELVAELGLEAVVVGHPDRASGLPGVAADERTALTRAVGALVDLGHERVAHVSGPATLVHSAERRDAWRDALLASGLPAGPVVEGDLTGEGGARATKRLLKRKRPPTAILYANDLMAIAGLRVARELGLRVPRDFSVVGFDDILLAEHVHPSLTTIRQDPVAAGAAAAKLLLQRLRGEPVSTPALPDPVLVVRDSIGPAPGTRAPRRGRADRGENLAREV
jgi:DNA-binding LacI/PurR family transcriptional regulator